MTLPATPWLLILPLLASGAAAPALADPQTVAFPPAALAPDTQLIYIFHLQTLTPAAILQTITGVNAALPDAHLNSDDPNLKTVLTVLQELSADGADTIVATTALPVTVGDAPAATAPAADPAAGFFVHLKPQITPDAFLAQLRKSAAGFLPHTALPFNMNFADSSKISLRPLTGDWVSISPPETADPSTATPAPPEQVAAVTSALDPRAGVQVLMRFTDATRAAIAQAAMQPQVALFLGDTLNQIHDADLLSLTIVPGDKPTATLALSFSTTVQARSATQAIDDTVGRGGLLLGGLSALAANDPAARQEARQLQALLARLMPHQAGKQVQLQLDTDFLRNYQAYTDAEKKAETAPAPATQP